MTRAISITNSEISTSFWIIGLILFFICFVIILDMWGQVPLLEFVLIMFLLAIALLFFSMAWIWPNYLISKYNLNLLIDKITNPNYIGWIRYTRSKGLRFHIVKKGPLGQTKGMANETKADVINDGEYTVTTQNGNQAIIKSDLLSINADLEKAIGWQLIKKHFGVIGYKAWEKCVDDDKTLFEKKPTEVNDGGREEV